MKKISIIILFLFSVIWAGSSADGAIIVGRISHIEGEIYRYMDVDNSWVETARQSPAGTGDILLTGGDSRAEISFPNDLLVMMDRGAEMEILNLDDDSGEFFLSAGLGRFYNKSVAGELRVESIMGTLKIRPGGVVDMQVDKQSATVAAVRGEAVFYSHENGAEKADIISGSTRLEFRPGSVLASRGAIDPGWDVWCGSREGVRAENALVRSRYLPESMQEFAYVMEPNGSWQRVYYRGYYYWAWKPHAIPVGWGPYTSGYWYDWQGDPVWIDYHPWGWVTHHYGSWIDLHGVWLWTPYVHVSYVPGVTVIGFNISFGKRFRPHWHPGRVRWISHRDHIGWLPLAPWESYYGHRRWGPRSVVVRDNTHRGTGINLEKHRYIDHAVVVPKAEFYKRNHEGTGNYSRIKGYNLRKSGLLRDYRPISVVGEDRSRKNPPGIIRNKNAGIRNSSPRAAGDSERIHSRVVEKRENTRERPVRIGRTRPEDINVTNSPATGRRQIEVNKQPGVPQDNKDNRVKISQRAKPSRTAGDSLRNRKEESRKTVGIVPRNRNAERDKPQQRKIETAGNPGRSRAVGAEQIERSGKRLENRQNRNAVLDKDRPETKRKVEGRDSRLSGNQPGRGSRGSAGTENDNRRKFSGNREADKAAENRSPAAGNPLSGREQGSIRLGRDYGEARRNWEADGLNGNRIR